MKNKQHNPKPQTGESSGHAEKITKRTQQTGQPKAIRKAENMDMLMMKDITIIHPIISL